MSSLVREWRPKKQRVFRLKLMLALIALKVDFIRQTNTVLCKHNQVHNLHMRMII